jgi:RES domain-containing protein
VLTVWRLLKSRHAASAFDGEGARLYGARWNSPGVRVAYAADSPALAVLEVLVHLQNPRILESYSIVRAEIPDELVASLSPADLPPDWADSPVPPSTQSIGDSWIRVGGSAVLRVPSTVVRAAYNHLLNPDHPNYARIGVSSPEPLTSIQDCCPIFRPTTPAALVATGQPRGPRARPGR